MWVIKKWLQWKPYLSEQTVEYYQPADKITLSLIDKQIKFVRIAWNKALDSMDSNQGKA